MEQYHTKNKSKILIVDDSEMNRLLLADMLENDFEIMQAVNGLEAIGILKNNLSEIEIVLLDMVMPEMDGFEVLAVMNKYNWIETVPVIMISAETSSAYMKRAYELGVTDYIQRPFDAAIVKKRVMNTIMLYAKQKKLISLVADQIYEKEKSNNLMINILSHIVEFRNGESGLHVLHIHTITELLLKQLVAKCEDIHLTHEDMNMISTASALHDIGKISIPAEVLNKPGRLTDEEFAIMKTHSAVGASMLEELPFMDSEPLVKTAYEICRWHHERYDGRGYPDGLKGDEIPISAQIVSIADVYDALTSERVYKKAFSHEKALEMIRNGECGVFNPVILKCLEDIADVLPEALKVNSKTGYSRNDVQSITEELLRNNEITTALENTSESEHVKLSFFTAVTNELQFDFIADPPMVSLPKNAAAYIGLGEIIVNPAEDENVLSIMKKSDIDALSALMRKTTPQEPDAEYECDIHIVEKDIHVKFICRSIWSSKENPQYIGTIGIVTYLG